MKSRKREKYFQINTYEKSTDFLKTSTKISIESINRLKKELFFSSIPNVAVILILAIVLFLSNINLSFAQYAQNEKQRLGESYEKTGDIKSAARIYKEVYDANPQSEPAFQGIVRTYTLLSQYSDLLDIVKKKIEKSETMQLHLLLGEMLWRTGKFKEGEEIWNAASKKYTTSPNFYQDLAKIQNNLRLTDRAINTLILGRKNLKQDNLFANLLSVLYIAVGDHVNGTSEILNNFYATNDLSTAQGQLYAFMTKDEAANYILERLESETSRNSNNVPLLMLYAWVLKASVKYERALDMYQLIDKKRNAQGAEIIGFAETARNDGQFDIALKAYSLIIDLGKSNQFYISALYGYTRTFEQKLSKENKLSGDEVNRIIDRYRRIAIEFPGQVIAAECRVSIASLAENHLGNMEMAINELNQIIPQYQATRYSAIALNKLGRIYILKNFPDSAKVLFGRVIRSYRNLAPEEIIRAQYNLALLEYFSGSMDTALVMFSEVAANANSDLANNALEKVSLIEQNKELVKALATYANAEFHEIRKQTDTAVALYLNTADYAQGEDLAEQSMIKAARLSMEKNNFSLANSIADTLLAKYPETIYGDEAMLITAKVQFQSGKKETALTIFSSLLNKYPNSIYSQEVRDAIRRIRNDKVQ